MLMELYGGGSNAETGLEGTSPPYLFGSLVFSSGAGDWDDVKFPLSLSLFLFCVMKSPCGDWDSAVEGKHSTLRGLESRTAPTT